MPDVAKCSNDKCTIKETCYRYTVKPDKYWQSYSKFNSELKEECKYFWKNNVKNTLPKT
jgi:hypothetical protein